MMDSELLIISAGVPAPMCAGLVLKICFFDGELSDLQKTTSYSGFFISLALTEARSNFYSTPIA